MSDSTQKNRLWNLRRLVKISGGTNAAAKKIGRSPSYITALCGPTPQRGIGDRTAALIEDAFEMAPGTLDVDPPKEVKNSDPVIAEIAETLSYSKDEDKEFMLAMSQWLVSRSMNEKPRTGKINLSRAADSLNSSYRHKERPALISKSGTRLAPAKPTRK